MTISNFITNNGTGAGTLAATLPSAPTTGNLMVLVGCSDDTISTPSGWTLKASKVSAAGFYVWTKTAGASEPSTVTLTIGGTDQSSMFVGEIPGVSGVDVVGTVTTHEGASVQTATVAAETTTGSSGDEVFAIAGFHSFGTAPATLAFDTGLAVVGQTYITNTSHGAGVAVGQLTQGSAGTVGPVTATWTNGTLDTYTVLVSFTKNPATPAYVRGSVTGGAESPTGVALTIATSLLAPAVASAGDLYMTLAAMVDNNGNPPNPPTFGGGTVIGEGGAGSDSSVMSAMCHATSAGVGTDGSFVFASPGDAMDEFAILVALINKTFVVSSLNFNNTSLIAPAATAPDTNDVLVCGLIGWVSNAGAVSGFTAPTGMTLIASGVSPGRTGGAKVFGALATQQLSSSGGTGTRTWPAPTGAVTGQYAASSWLAAPILAAAGTRPSNFTGFAVQRASSW